MILLIGAVACAAPAWAQPPTFNADVAPIFNRSCVSCHHAGDVAPMALTTYEEARPWARSIRTRVASREMPPWFADPTFSRPLANEARLSDAEIATIVAWVDAGARQGSGTAPPVAPIAQGWHRFKDRPPDVILDMPMAFAIPAEGSVPIFTLWAPNPFTEDQFIEAVELRPSATAAVHHSDVTARALPAGTTLGRGRAWKGGPLVDFVPVYPDGRSYNELTADDVRSEVSGEGRDRRRALQDEAFRTTDDYRLLFYVPGGGFQEFPPGAVKRISAGNVLAWNLHYSPTGRPETDRHRLGLWLARTPPTHEVVTKRIGEAHIIDGKEFVADRGGAEFPPIPALAGDWRVTAITPIQEDITLYGLWPHMHLRGKDMTFIATFPDGREEVLLHVPKFDFNWQLQYELKAPLRLPAGSTIKAIGHYDNSAKNRNNPRPDAPVHWSEQSWDEMFNGWMELSVDRHVITRQATYTLATPVNRRVSLAIGNGPAGSVRVRNRDGSLVTSGTIGATPSFIEPWVFAPGQTLQTERAGIDSGTVTVTMFDVPPDVTASATIGGPPVEIAIAQPGQNARVTFTASAAEHVTIQVTGNTINGVSVGVVSADRGTALATVSASTAQFTLEVAPTLAPGAYHIIIDPNAAAIGRLAVSIDRSKQP